MNFNARKIFIISILAICVIAINLAVYFQITKKPAVKEEEGEVIIDTALLTENFNNIFDNQINYQNNNVTSGKIDNTKELIYTSYINNEKIENSYELNVNIPYLNQNSDSAQKINEEINNLFYKKVEGILVKTDKYTVYNVKYKAYVNDNILSLVISSTLKEGNNPQREIMKTYNYNLSSNDELNIEQILEYRKVSAKYAQSKINETIKLASENANKYKELGYNKYLRNINDEMYKVENTSVYFLGENKALYIIYAYGNSNYTSEIDLLVI